MTGQDDVPQELMPEKSAASHFDWWRLQIATVALLIAFAGPLWYFIYLTPQTPGTIADTVTGIVVNSPVPASLFLGLLMVFGAMTLFAPAYTAYKHHQELKAKGADASNSLLILAAIGFQFWPFHLFVLWKHYNYRKELINRD